MSLDPDPPIPTDVDLRDFPFTPLFRSRLFGSEFHAHANDSAWRAGVTLWLKSWDQTPVGSLPDDDIALCRLAELGKDVKTWRKLREWALHGWFKCANGRLYHKVVSEGINDAISAKISQRNRTAAARAARQQQRLSHTQSQKSSAKPNGSGGTSGSDPPTDHATDIVTDNATETVTASKGQGQGQGQEIKEDSVAIATGADAPIPRDPVKEFWVRAKAALGQSSGSIIGKARRDYGDTAVMEAVVAVENECPSQPVEFFIGCLQHHRRYGNGRGKERGIDRAIQDAQQWLDSRTRDRPVL